MARLPVGVQQKVKQSHQNIKCGGCNDGFGVTTGSYLGYQHLGSTLFGVGVLISVAWNAYRRRQIKQRQAAELALNDRLEFMRSLVNGTPHPIYVRDRQGLLQSCNDS
jgi:PAS domain-containing protein